MTWPSFDGLTPEIALLDRLLDRLDRALVVGRDGEDARLGHAEAGDLLQRDLAAVGVDLQLLDQPRRRATGAHRGELRLQVADRLAHLVVALVEDECLHLVAVGTHARPFMCRPRAHERADALAESARWMLPGAVTSNTTIGSSLSMQKVIAVESITFRPLLRISKWLTCGELHRGGVEARVGAVHAVDPGVRALQDRLGADLRRPQRGGGVGGEVGVAGAGGEHHHPSLLEVADGAARDERLGHLRHGDRGLHARGLTHRLERVLQRERVDHGGRACPCSRRGRGPCHASRPTCPARCCRRRRRPRSRRRARPAPSATSSAMRCTTAASMPKLVVVSANASPDSFRTTRRYCSRPRRRTHVIGR